MWSAAELVHDVMTGAIPVVLAWGAWLLRNAWLRIALGQASARAGGIAYVTMLSSRADGAELSEARERAIDAGMDHMWAAYAGTINTLGVKTESLRGMVSGELGRLLAADPTVTVEVPARDLLRGFRGP